VKLAIERKLWKKGFNLIAGVDEAGRGPLAGPVVAAAVILPKDISLKGLNDSKQLSPNVRERLFDEIQAKAISIGLGQISHKVIDQINIWQANLLAMKQAVNNLLTLPDYLLIDGKRHRIAIDVPQEGITGGDAKSPSIAAASIVAKVTRDRMMLGYHLRYPGYRFDLHKGYGTRRHFRALRKLGPCPIHRKTFFPVKDLV
jgi:ribonuclease HII